MCYTYMYHHVCIRCNEVLEVTTLRKQECYKASCDGEIKSPPRILKRLVQDDSHLEWCMVSSPADDNFLLVTKDEEGRK